MQFLFVEDLKELDIDLKRKSTKSGNFLSSVSEGLTRWVVNSLQAATPKFHFTVNWKPDFKQVWNGLCKIPEFRAVHHMHLCGHAQSWTKRSLKHYRLVLNFIYVKSYTMNSFVFSFFCLMLLFWNSCYCMSCSLFILIILLYFLMWIDYIYFWHLIFHLISSWLKLCSFPSR